MEGRMFWLVSLLFSLFLVFLCGEEKTTPFSLFLSLSLSKKTTYTTHSLHPSTHFLHPSTLRDYGGVFGCSDGIYAVEYVYKDFSMVGARN
ncbi:hypothetical protein IC582_013521 [Cucumis melo]